MLQVMPMKSSYLGKSATHGLALGTLWVAKSEMTPAGSLIENAFRRRHRRMGDCTAFPACRGAPAAERSREGGERPGDAAHAPLSGTPRATSERRGRCPSVTGRAGRRPSSPVWANTRHPNICELDLERSRGALAATLLWEHGPCLASRAASSFFLVQQEFAHRPGSSALAAGQVRRQVTPEGA
jgi:hypothetical protein